MNILWWNWTDCKIFLSLGRMVLHNLSKKGPALIFTCLETLFLRMYHFLVIFKILSHKFYNCFKIFNELTVITNQFKNFSLGAWNWEVPTSLEFLRIWFDIFGGNDVSEKFNFLFQKLSWLLFELPRISSLPTLDFRCVPASWC